MTPLIPILTISIDISTLLGVGRTKPSLDIFSTRQESLLIQGRMRETLNTSSSSLGAYLSNAKVLNGITEARAKTIAEHVSTSEVAKDMLSIITAYGREKLQYWGVSCVLSITFFDVSNLNLIRVGTAQRWERRKCVIELQSSS